MVELAPTSRLAESAPVLLAVVNKREDWRRIVDEGWYRIPLKHAPHPVAAEALAFYCTKPSGEAAWQVVWYASVLRYSIATRQELLPAEPDHPRAAERYYRIALGRLQRLKRPVPSRRLRRITFIPTTFGRLCTATDVADLWQIDDADLVWTHFPDAAIKATSRLQLEE